jgi:site-specific DNA recombinase
LQEKLLRKDLFEEFCQEFTREMNRLRMAARAGLTAAEQELGRVQHQISKLVQALKDGVPAGAIKDELIELETRKTELRIRLERANEPPPLLHPNMADLYRRKVTELAEALADEEAAPVPQNRSAD